jgi:glycosyltransferase involved in cell wall biosynthesis
MNRCIVMIGTDLRTRGGVSAVVQVYADEGLLRRHRVLYLPTHCDGGPLRKLAAALRAWLRYLLLLVTGRVALLHAHSASGPSFWRKSCFIVPSLWLGVPVVLHWHGGGFVGFFQRSRPWQRRFIGWLFRRCERVVALSDQWYDTLTRTIPGIRAVTITNPVMLPAAAASLQGEPPTVLFLGLVHEQKGVFDLLRAWVTVRRRVPGARLRIGGVGELAAAQALARELGIADAVDWLGWIGPGQKAAELARAWLLVLPSYAEGVPMALLEAMAAGVPVVATRVGGIPLAVRDGTDGLLLEPGRPAALSEALASLLQDRERRLAMGASVRRRAAAEFSMDVIAPKLEALWAELLHGPVVEAPR